MDKFITQWLTSGAVLSACDGSVWLGAGEVQRAASHSQLDPRYPSFYVPDFFLQTEKPWHQYATWHQLTLDQLSRFLGEDSSHAHSINWQMPHEAVYRRAFAELKGELSKGELEKVVLYTMAHAAETMTQTNLKHSLRCAVNSLIQSHGYLYGYWDRSNGMLGVTPEVLFNYNVSSNRVLHTMALAGTAPRSVAAEDFLNDAKERCEHAFVINGIQSAGLVLGEVLAQETSILSLPTLQHLYTPLTIRLRAPFDFIAAVTALHPTPALGGFPRDTAGRWLMDYQKQLARGHFGAPFGLLLPTGEAHCVVAIRQVQWNVNEMRIGVGGGVVQASQVDREWSELLLKLQATRGRLGL